MPTLKTNYSFARGELDPSLHSRADLQDYAAGAKTVRNFIVERQGGAANRPGFEWVCELRYSNKVPRLIPFVFNMDNSYCLVFEDLSLRFIKNGAQIRETGVTIAGITQASPGVVTTSGAHSYSSGDEVYLSGVVGMTEVNGRNFKIAVTGANTFQLLEMDGATAFNTSTFTAYSSGGTSARVYQITTPYTEAQLPELTANAQSADVLILNHPSHAPRELVRTNDTSWALSTISFVPQQVAPHGTSAIVGAGGSVTIKYRACAVNDESGEESLPARGVAQNITNITQANPAVVTYAGADSFANDDEIFITGVTGMTQVNDLAFTVANVNVGANTFELRGINSTAYTAYSAGGTVALTYARINNAAGADPNAHQFLIPVLSGCKKYNVYKCFANSNGGGGWGFVGIAEATGSPAAGTITFNDPGYVPDTSIGHPVAREPFSTANSYPRCGTFYQGRLIQGGSESAPATLECSRTEQYKNFTRTVNGSVSDAITIPLRQTTRIRHVMDLQTLIAFSESAEWAILGNQAGVLTPGDVNPRRSSYNGIGAVAPVPVNNTAVYVTGSGDKIRDLLYDFNADGYAGVDLSLKSAHLFEGHEIVDLAYQKHPDSIVWAVRDDGTLLGLTYVREQEVAAWHRHDTEGEFERTACVPESHDTALYVAVAREIGGETKRYVEREASRSFTEIEDAIHMDSFLTYDGRNTDATNTVTLNSAGTTATLAVSKGAGAVGDEIHVRGADGLLVRFTITSSGGALVWNGTSDRTVPASIAGVAISDWAYAVDSVTPLWHLEGMDVSAIGDGHVIANPNNATHTALTVTNGTVNFDEHYGVIHVGLPYLSDLKTLDIDTASGSLTGRAKLVNRVYVSVHKTRGIWLGAAAPDDDDDDPIQGLAEHAPRENESMDDPPSLLTEVIDQPIAGEWSKGGSVFLRILDPVPARVLSIIPSGQVN